MLKKTNNLPHLTACALLPDILNLLKVEDRTGYQIAKQLKELPGNSFQVKEGYLYPVLKWMEQAKYIRFYWSKADVKRPKKFYSICLRGKKALASEDVKRYSVLETI